MKKVKHFIWDYDGTLLDTYPNVVRYLYLALKDFGVEVDKKEIFENLLESLRYSLDYYSKLYSLPKLAERYKFYAANEPNDPVYTFPFVKDVLKQIRENGAYNYIFTNRGDVCLPFLEKCGIKDEFVEIVTSDNPNFVIKPAPDAILYLMKKYGGNQDDTVMIGDRLCDLESAYAAGCKTIHIVTPSIPQSFSCDWRFESYEEMLKLLV